MKRYFLLALLTVANLTFALAQTRIVQGIVTSSADKEPLVGVTVKLKNKSQGTQTDINGRFSIPASEADVLIFTYIGYITQEREASASTLSIILKPDAASLDEIVVIGYGTTSRSKVTSAIAKLDTKILETGIRSNPAQALAGTIAGVRVTTSSGRPGSLPGIVLRGGTNFDGSGSPLIVIDGQVRGSLSDINPEDISSMEVLKDASSTAIYGARASNGVVLITTKRGKTGAASLDFKVKTGFNYLNMPYKFLNAEEYLYWTRKGVVEAIKNGTTNTSMLSGVGPRGTGNLYKDAKGVILDGNYDTRAVWSVMRLTDDNRELLSKGEGWKTMKDAVTTDANGNYDPDGTNADLLFKDFNYGDYAFKSPALTQDYNLGMTGGNEKGHYYANAGFFNDEGLSLKTFYRRLNFTFNGDYKLRNWLTSESNFAYIKANWRDQTLKNDEAWYWGRMLSAPPTMRGKNENGELLLGRDHNDGNPLVNIDKFKVSNQTDKFTIGQSFKVDIAKDLYARVGGTLMYDEGFYESFNKDYRVGTLSYTDPNKGWNRDRYSDASFDRTIRQTYNAVLNYSTRMEKHHFDAMAGSEYYDSYLKGFSANGKLAPTDDFQDLNLTDKGENNRGMDSFHSRERILSFFGRLIYDWDDKYLATITVRSDGYSRLLGDNRFGTFPAASVGWLVHKENFMEGTKPWLSFLKLRAGWGKNGNVGGIGTYELQGSYLSQTAYNSTIGFLLSNISNPALRWEKTNTVEFAADMGFLNRINASLAYYNRVTDDKIASVLLPTSAGINSIKTNNGSLRNQGVEFDVNVKAVQKPDFNWSIGANAAWNKNKILKLPYNGNERNRQGGQQIYDPKSRKVIWVGGYQEGREPGEIFGFVSDGIIRTAQELKNYQKIDLAAGEVWDGNAAGKRVASKELIESNNLNPDPKKPSFISTQLGDMRWKDVDGNDTIDRRDMVSIGRVRPRWTGGFNTSVNYKRLALFARFDYGLGHRQMDFQQMWSLGSLQGEFNVTEVVKDTWTPENPNAKYPRYTWADQLNSKNFDRPSDMFWVNASYLAFREVSLSYSVPPKWLQRAHIAGLTLTATGQNLGYLTHDFLKLPERSGWQNSAYTIPTTLIFGASVTF